MASVSIRALGAHEELRACERIQVDVWGSVGVSAELLSVTRKYGGAVIGSVVDGKVAGFLYAFLARRHGRLIHWSHLMAIEPEYRDRGLGFRMKLAHRKLALAQGLDSICWTYDPLQSRNSALNVGRLGGSPEEYLPNCYGQFQSAIEKNLESDRFVLNWRISTAAVARRLRGDRRPDAAQAALLGTPRINETRRNSSGFLENQLITFNLREPQLLVEIPTDTDRMRAEDLALARRWRSETRRIFVGYYRRQYRVVDFVPPSEASDQRAFYVLRRTHLLGR